MRHRDSDFNWTANSQYLSQETCHPAVGLMNELLEDLKVCFKGSCDNNGHLYSDLTSALNQQQHSMTWLDVSIGKQEDLS